MRLTKEQKRIAELEAALYSAELKLERLEEAEEQKVTKSSITVKPVELTSFKQHSRAIDDSVAASQYLSTGQVDALGELRWQVIHCRTPQQVLDHEKQLMRTKAASCSATAIGQLARDVSIKSVLGSKVTTQLAVFNALFELDRVQEEMDVSDFTDDLLKHDATSILNNSAGKLSDLVALRKARMNGSFEQIEQAIEKILSEDNE
ncbi:hypothetical protein K08M3_14340 [Vibrio alginolyticus]|uniref:Uncharacterized protein n=1 Tax=Vibrio alginolyticus TaxID=663 RepID=A0A1W6W2R4_VIBAL|nr:MULTISPECIES: hypothetical protein [Vibrio]ARO98374.1 hypothetical protein K01M1_14310 [Vibrio alginolyticus]ARP03091.1 hypothetical protein K04M1_14430 [Vibrio alginolyticus]ARP08149.1 hypothetical protein K04M3_14460 [Vibrio alginolyticus]ARP13211.1 hypothetical protein K04M5_14110 [Vibrio alginolyticus]ARP18271.1 hypothetical protein K05K4_14350 [Vibrio alginolyticus]